ncbi:RNA polymerase sigma-70 factor (ECF subfamily) [Pseudomonas duriflava]|uniref:RNA polymerase sigma-70 factor (ECF subfamily) n=1 Tax=Pseudomonas duriflava TaxID=459528 RepID=A0A562QIX5_9PSED|nr:sigma-70 family RNA polymerase sigma factor [Pseudomonas duriflava]TWI56691.1 RNA polymerase sigma-70 factor (ECF subfamily) [Pseudomonas duriflava]
MATRDVNTAHWLSMLYRSHGDWLAVWLRRQTGCSHRAEDLCQDTFVRLLNKAERPVLREPRAFLINIAKGLLIDQYRRAQLERNYLEGLANQPEDIHPSPEELAILVEALAEVERLLGTLSPKARAAFFYNRLDGLTHAEIATRLGVSVPRVRQYIAQGLRQCYIALYGTPHESI